MKIVCEKNKCNGCMACVEVCRQKAIEIEDSLDAYNAVIHEEVCIHCNACTHVCPNNSDNSYFTKTLSWYQGWSNDEGIRKNSSSGAAAYELAKVIIECGGCVFSCLFSNGKFVFDEADGLDELKKFAGSKYVKSNPLGVYSNVKKRLKEGKTVLFIGLPCQVAALKKYVGESENLYTVDLICHGTPSPKLLGKFLEQYSCSLDQLHDIRFRIKAQYQITSEDRIFFPHGGRDPYMIAFLNGLIYTENCYSCKYARKERVSDITIGDSWKSDLPSDEQRRGISLILVQTKKGNELLKRSSMRLHDVDIEKAILANHQLQHPTNEPQGRKAFFEKIKEGKKFNTLVKYAFPKQYIKQRMKAILIR